MKRGRWKRSKRPALSSSHPEGECFDRKGQTVRLRSWAQPTSCPSPVQTRKVILQKSLVRKNPKRPASTSGDEMSPPTPSVTPSADGLIRTGSNGPEMMPLSIPVRTLSTPKVSDHNYALLESPQQLKRKVDVLNEQLEVIKKKFKYEKQKSTRLQIKVSRLTALIKSLNDEGSY